MKKTRTWGALLAMYEIDKYEVHHEDLHDSLIALAKTATRSIEIFAPYIKKDTLARFVEALPNRDVPISIITTWKLKDLIVGVTDLEVYPYCKTNGIYFFVNNRIHLKTYLVDYTKVLIGSANMTGRGMGLAKDSNYETLVELPTVPSDYIINLARIKKEASHVQDAYYEEMAAAVARLKPKYQSNDGELNQIQQEIESRVKKDHFLISELPMSMDLKTIYDVLMGKEVEDPAERINAEHDIATYDLDRQKYKNYEEFREVLKARFFAHPFVLELCGYVTECKRFGEIRQWVKNTCTNVPIPYSKEVTPYVQALYEWLKDVGSDKFYEKIPNHSQLLCPKTEGLNGN